MDGDGILHVLEMIVNELHIVHHSLQVRHCFDAEAIQAVGNGVVLSDEVGYRRAIVNQITTNGADRDTVTFSAFISAENSVNARRHSNTVVMVEYIVIYDGHILITCQVEAIGVLVDSVAITRVECEPTESRSLAVDDAECVKRGVLDRKARDSRVQDGRHSEKRSGEVSMCPDASTMRPGRLEFAGTFEVRWFPLIQTSGPVHFAVPNVVVPTKLMVAPVLALLRSSITLPGTVRGPTVIVSQEKMSVPACDGGKGYQSNECGDKEVHVDDAILAGLFSWCWDGRKWQSERKVVRWISRLPYMIDTLFTSAVPKYWKQASANPRLNPSSSREPFHVGENPPHGSRSGLGRSGLGYLT
ncbi:unnamed protein product [Peronospora belbahrii]|uniref:Uncharacterized protein n=1 Tax=Peronospora belbahrii TaxID=622444 RepID=A0AAU9KLA5_9STRA|nr:unnamed protein product [Peronospora belbahrii]